MNNNISLSNVLVGMSIIGSFEKYLLDILRDNCKLEICLVVFYKNKGRLPENEEEMFNDEDVIEQYDNLKNYFRRSFEYSLNRENENLLREKERKSRDEANKKRQKEFLAKNNFKKMNGVAPEGTVDELAQKYGLSKSKIRELKREGRLHELNHIDKD